MTSLTWAEVTCHFFWSLWLVPSTCICIHCLIFSYHKKITLSFYHQLSKRKTTASKVAISRIWSVTLCRKGRRERERDRERERERERAFRARSRRGGVMEASSVSPLPTHVEAQRPHSTSGDATPPTIGHTRLPQRHLLLLLSSSSAVFALPPLFPFSIFLSTSSTSSLFS